MNDTDAKLAHNIRDDFTALRHSIYMAQKAGLTVEFDKEIQEDLQFPQRVHRPIQITRKL